MNRFFGGPVVPVILKLIVASFLVGILLSVFSIEPLDLWDDFIATIVRVWNMGWGFIEWGITYFLLGAVIVVPIWLLVRFWSVIVDGGKTRRDETGE